MITSVLHRTTSPLSVLLSAILTASALASPAPTVERAAAPYTSLPCHDEVRRLPVLPGGSPKGGMARMEPRTVSVCDKAPKSSPETKRSPAP